jgi:hypothetical protein
MRMLVKFIMAAIITTPGFAPANATSAQDAAEAPRPGATITPMPAGVRPLRGQTPEQTQIDVAQCRNVASEATGYVPGANVAMPEATNAPAGGRVRGAAVGAGVGAIVGDAGVGAATGAVAGGMNQRQNRRMSAAQQQQAAAAQSQRATAWMNSNVGCLQSRGYAVEKPPVAAPAG